MRTILLITAFAAGLVVSGCSASNTATLAGTRFPKGASVCGYVHDVTSLKVTRTGVINKETFTFPSSDDIRHTSSAQRVATEICSLPTWPKGTYFCPDAWGPTYRLNFFDKGTPIAAMDATPTGCASVNPLANVTPGSSRVANARFWKVLGAAIGLHGATASTFAGTMS
jgi:uncharacterized protein YceK